jgi:MscS family membrane protein
MFESIVASLNQLLKEYPILIREFNDVDLWIWLCLPIFFITAYILSRVIVTLVYKAFEAAPKLSSRFGETLSIIRRPVSLFLCTLLFSATLTLLGSEDGLEGVRDLTTCLYALSVCWLALVVATRSSERMRNHWIRRGNVTAAALIPLLRKLAQVGIVTVTLLFLLQNWGFDIAAMLAALGIGGIALALASQKSVENLFGGIMLSLDQPIRVGEFGKFGEVLGVVQDIGLRSTRIRSLQNTLVSVPNSEMANMTIESFGPRSQILFTKQLPLRHETTIEQIQLIRLKMQESLEEHQKIVKNSARVRLIDFNADAACVLEIWSYVDTQDWNEFMELQEMFLLTFRAIIEASGTELAHPAKTVYLQHMAPVSEEKQRRVDSEVANLQKEHKISPIQIVQ